MADIFREVDEDLRHERYLKLWRRWRHWLLGVGVAALGGCGRLRDDCRRQGQRPRSRGAPVRSRCRRDRGRARRRSGGAARNACRRFGDRLRGARPARGGRCACRARRHLRRHLRLRSDRGGYPARPTLSRPGRSACRATAGRPRVRCGGQSTARPPACRPVAVAAAGDGAFRHRRDARRQRGGGARPLRRAGERFGGAARPAPTGGGAA